MNGYLLDTCICVFLFRNKFDIEKKLNQIGFSDCYVSEVTLAELRYGAYKSNRTEHNLDLIERFAEKVNIVPFAETIDFYANEKNRLNKQGTPIEDFDLLIASAAYVRNLKLVTDNLKHFKNVQGLVVENWVER
jgi:tRNA(fMet)-specific endonuclease VapC